MKIIKLTKGMECMVDDDLYDHLNQWKWNVLQKHGKSYAYRNSKKSDNLGLPPNKRVSILMHRYILGVTDFKVKVDHEDHDGLNNQRYNIRACSNSDNLKNRKSGWGSSKYLGVSKRTNGYKGRPLKVPFWTASILVGKKHTYLGSFKEEKLAAVAYNNAAAKYHGEFANLNKV